MSWTRRYARNFVIYAYAVREQDILNNALRTDEPKNHDRPFPRLPNE